MSQIAFATAVTVTLQANSTISAATNASPIAVTTTANHLLITGDIVQITGTTGNLGTNGKFVVTKTGATTFTLNNSNGSGAWVSGGTVVHIGHVTSVLVDNTVYASAPSWTVKAKAESVAAGTGYRFVFEDAADSGLLTSEPFATFAGSGALSLSNGKAFSAKAEDAPDVRIASSGDNWSLRVYLSGGPGATMQYSAWIE